MDIQTRKIKFVQKFLSIKNEEMLLRFEELLKIAQAENKRELKPFTTEELNQRIDQSEKDFENGLYKTTSEILKKFDL
ncbi:MAG TPA: hypothetical protein VK106_00200 [Balneolaceae bacterium]|nr:hypothetical protein [Balneolaceae bacterium]